MDKKLFEKLVSTNNAVPLPEGWMVFNDLEVFNLKTHESVQYGSFEDLYEHQLSKSETIGEYVDRTDEIYFEFLGGRGASSDKMGGGFGHAESYGPDDSRERFPLELNIGGRYQDYSGTLAEFSRRYSTQDHEFGITVDSQGFVTQHIEGGKSEVRVNALANQMVIHNHPSGSNFSDTDLISTASSRSSGVVAVGRDNTYTFRKGRDFNAKGFIKAVGQAKWPARMDYNTGADWWLKRNSKKYGYTYTRTKTSA